MDVFTYFPNNDHFHISYFRQICANLRGNRLIIYLSNVGDREHIKDTQSIIHRFCTNPLKPHATLEAGSIRMMNMRAFVEFHLGTCQWLLGLEL